ncbi:hypothetical protein [Planomicrobium sp. MB-3u-38]|uniref:hypothetical protein n=1 Tax=Planomicrobium sp. MB-3u-38 TaxID=2058318 RepID=UPI001E5D0092|nr:hypothetical protein [Planomicrobium sp. MB-3u-38]
MKKSVSVLLAASLLASAPWSSVVAYSPKVTYVNALEEQDGSKFNSENYDFTKFSAIGPKLEEIAKSSNRVKVEVTGTSSEDIHYTS